MLQNWCASQSALSLQLTPVEAKQVSLTQLQGASLGQVMPEMSG